MSLIEESEVDDQAAERVTTMSHRGATPEWRAGLGARPYAAAEKERGMQAFKDGLIQGARGDQWRQGGVDVPNASLIIIQNAQPAGRHTATRATRSCGRGRRIVIVCRRTNRRCTL